MFRLYFISPDNRLHRILYVEGLRLFDFEKVSIFFHNDNNEFIPELTDELENYKVISQSMVELMDNICLKRYKKDFKTLFNDELENLPFVDFEELILAQQFLGNQGIIIKDKMVKHFKLNGFATLAAKLKDHKGKYFFLRKIEEKTEVKEIE